MCCCCQWQQLTSTRFIIKISHTPDRQPERQAGIDNALKFGFNLSFLALLGTETVIKQTAKQKVV